MLITIIEIVITLVIIICCIRALNYIYSWKVLPVVKEITQDCPLISILIPARNEERAIGECLESLIKQTYPNLEIIVIDDESSDKTAEIVKELTNKDSRIRLISSRPLPQGWLGKCWALHQGTQQSGGDWFLFSDADVIHSPHTLNSVYLYAVKNNIDFLTLKFTFLVKSFWEKVVIPSIFFIKYCFVPSPKRVNSITSSDIEAKGDFIFVKRKVYEKLGGHQTVKNDFIESGALMCLFKKSNYKVSLLDGSHLITVRKFHNLGEIINSYAKLCYKMYESKANMSWIMMNVIIVALIISPFFILMFSLCSGEPNIKLIFWTVIQLLILLTVAVIVYKKERFSILYVISFPLGSILSIYTIFKALFIFLFIKKRTWRGRVY